jgi:hypothetical protein
MSINHTYQSLQFLSENTKDMIYTLQNTRCKAIYIYIYTFGQVFWTATWYTQGWQKFIMNKTYILNNPLQTSKVLHICYLESDVSLQELSYKYTLTALVQYFVQI